MMMEGVRGVSCRERRSRGRGGRVVVVGGRPGDEMRQRLQAGLKPTLWRVTGMCLRSVSEMHFFF